MGGAGGMSKEHDLYLLRQQSFMVRGMDFGASFSVILGKSLTFLCLVCKM